MFVQLNSHPSIVLVPNIEVPSSVQDVSNLLVLVQVLVEEHLDLAFVRIAHRFRRDGNLVAILIASLGSDSVDIRDVWIVEGHDSKLVEVLLVDLATRVVWVSLVALKLV